MRFQPGSREQLVPAALDFLQSRERIALNASRPMVLRSLENGDGDRRARASLAQCLNGALELPVILAV